MVQGERRPTRLGLLALAALVFTLCAVTGIARAFEIQYVHTDHLGTPEMMTDQGGRVVWRADHAPFGNAVESISVESSTARFPGQHFDAESGLHYNYFRDYDPKTGRYVEPDPIGLGGGASTYTYVHGNPLRHVDAYGLAPDVGGGFTGMFGPLGLGIGIHHREVCRGDNRYSESYVKGAVMLGLGLSVKATGPGNSNIDLVRNPRRSNIDTTTTTFGIGLGVSVSDDRGSERPNSFVGEDSIGLTGAFGAAIATELTGREIPTKSVLVGPCECK